MGLDFSHGSARWSYSSFMAFREDLAEHEGLELRRMHGYAVPGDYRPRVSWKDVTTPLKPLLNHSDCDGHLTPEECRQVAARLREVVPLVFDEDDYDYRRGLDLAEGMEMAADAGELFEFC